MNMEYLDFNIDHIYQILVTMNGKKATGCDGIPCILLKIGALLKFFVILKIRLLMNVYFLACWSLLKSLHFLKNLTGYARKSFRPMNILTALSKVFERNHANQISSFFEKIFSKFLSGFRKGYSDHTTLLRMIQDWKMPLIMAILLDQLQLISAKHSTVCPMGYSWPNSMHMVLDYLHVKYYVAIYIIATTEWRCVTWKVSGWILKRVYPKGQYWGPCCSYQWHILHWQWCFDL